MRLVFVTGEDLLDVDLPIVKEIHERYDFLWIVILKGYGWFTKERIESFCEENGISVKVFTQQDKLKNPRNVCFHWKILRVLRTARPDLVYDSYLGVPFMHLISGFFISEDRYIIAIHDVIQHYKMNFRTVRRTYYDFMMRKFQNIHVFSENQKRALDEKFPGKNVLKAGLCLKDFGTSIATAPLHKIPMACNFLFFGIIRANKGVDILIEAGNRLAEKYSNFSITIAGRPDAHYGDVYFKKIIYPDRFKLLVRTIKEEEVASLFHSAHFLVLPYRDVTQSGALLTSFNYQVPAIASDHLGFREYLTDAKNGFLFESENIDALVLKMEKAILMNEYDYNQMKDCLSELVEREVSTRAISEKYIQYFNQFSTA